MRKLTSSDLKDLNLFKHYRIIRKWVKRNYNIRESDFELLIYLDSLQYFNKQDFKDGCYSYSWDNRRWSRLFQEDWIVIFRKRNRTTQKYHIYKTSLKFKQMLSRVYRIILGEEDIPMNSKNSIMRKETYMDKVLYKSILDLNKDKKR
jgi:hypothetical protein